MRFRVQRVRALVMLMVGGASIAMMPGQANAQFGGGGMGGFGWGFGFNQVPSPTNFINNATIARMGHVHFGPQQNSPYAGNPNAYFNHAMDNGFVDRYRADRREPSYYGTPSSSSRVPQESPSPAAPAAARPQPNLPLASFYKADGQIEWPTEAPAGEGLKQKRDEFDKLSKNVLAELKTSGVASIASVSEARQKLLDYGRPALHYAKEHETPRVVDTFHLFLMSLYESLAQATNPVAVATPAPALTPSPATSVQ
jgi:hypothetical protein